MMYEIRMTTAFKKDLKLAKKRGLDLSELETVITELQKGNTLEPKYRDHDLHGNWEGYRECHVEPDWLLIYKQDKNELLLFLVRTGTHSDLL